MDLRERFNQRVVRGVVRRFNNGRIEAIARQLRRAEPAPSGQPVAFFKASTGIDDLSWNSGFHLLASWALRLRGVPVVYFTCRAGMSRCVLGTDREDAQKPPPCRTCIGQSRTLYAGLPEARRGKTGSGVSWFNFDRDAELEAAIQGLSLAQLMEFSWLPEGVAREPKHAAPVLPLGRLCLPGLRWILRLHNLEDNESTRFLLREYILSAWSVAQHFSMFLDQTMPRAVVVFNGQFFPEAVARHVAEARGIPVVTHEVGLRPASAFFTAGEATAYPIQIPGDFELSAEQDSRLDAYLEERFQGRFTMAGIQFWPSMRPLDERFLAKSERFKQVVPIFTNVIFDTSQPHANKVFADMFGWLDAVIPEVHENTDTLFVIRAHPDETRLRKESRETVEAWARRSGALEFDNVVFIAPQEYISSYELIQRAKFVMVYNSTIGLEASIMGVPVLCAGKARFTQYPTVFFPQSRQAHLEALRSFLAASEIPVPPEFRRNARRFLYYQIFRTSLPFGEFLEPSVRKTQSRLKRFRLERLTSALSLKVIADGLLHGGDFLIPEDAQFEGKAG